MSALSIITSPNCTVILFFTSEESVRYTLSEPYKSIIIVSVFSVSDSNATFPTSQTGGVISGVYAK